MDYLRNIGANNYQRGATRWAHPTWARQAPRRALVGCGLLGPPPVPILWYICHFDLEKIRRRLLGRSAVVSRRNLGRSTFALRRSDSTEGTSLREGEIEAIVITKNPLNLGGSINIDIFTSTISS